MINHLSERGKKWVRTLPPLVKAHFDNFYNMYDKDTNPEGLINMGTAESHLVNKEICELLKIAGDRMELTGMNIHYNKFEGSDEFKTAIANYWQSVIFGEDSDVVLTKENVATCAGCTVALESLATMLGDPGDVILLPAPYYSSFTDDINERAGLIPVNVQCAEDLNRDALEQAYEEQTKLGRKVVAILYATPNNPIGNVYTEEQIKGAIDFAMAHDIEIISDEIYAQTIFDPEAKHVSTMKLVPAEYRHRVHVTSSFAKDFVLSGLRTGMVFSFNPCIIQGMGSITYYSSVSSHTQALLTEVLLAPELPAIMQLSRDRLFTAYKTIEKTLNDMGVKTMKAQAGIFIFADFTPYMDKPEFASEQILWEKIYNDLMVNVSPGHLFGTDKPGWFRLCYAFDQATVEEACRRLATLAK